MLELSFSQVRGGALRTLLIVICFLGCDNSAPSNRKEEYPKKESSVAHDPPIASLSEAQKSAPGIWTFVEPLSPKETAVLVKMSNLVGASAGDQSFWNKMPTGTFGWLRFVIKDGGECERHFALPAFNDWGKAVKCRWKATTEKYLDTGARYYAITVTDQGGGGTAYNLIYIDKQHLSLADAGQAGIKIISRKDAAPFSP